MQRKVYFIGGPLDGMIQRRDDRASGSPEIRFPIMAPGAGPVGPDDVPAQYDEVVYERLALDRVHPSNPALADTDIAVFKGESRTRPATVEDDILCAACGCNPATGEPGSEADEYRDTPGRL